MGKKTSAHYDKPLNVEASGSGGAKTAGVTFKKNGDALQRNFTDKELKRYGKKAAKVLGISRQSVYRTMEEAGLLDLSKNGQAAHLNEPQAAAVKPRPEKKHEVKTRLEKALRLKDELIQELKDENTRLAAAFGREVLDHRRTRAALSEAELETVQRIAEAGCLLVSDREDLLNTYRRKQE